MIWTAVAACAMSAAAELQRAGDPNNPIYVHVPRIYEAGWAQNVVLSAAQVTLERPDSALVDPLKESGVASETTLADQQDVAVTVYNNNLALVRDTRAIKMMP
ncbi:MAG: hypothetical protein IT365_17000, partial [Candidatus Hydrogenedentes bacterium]|nr:hypothetical protein [Candidatus Hydrogenedentota bacterium]